MIQPDTDCTIRGIRVRLDAEHLRVMRLMAEGCNYREIGCALGLSRGSVHNLVCDVKNAIGTESRIEALLLLADAGILQVA